MKTPKRANYTEHRRTSVVSHPVPLPNMPVYDQTQVATTSMLTTPRFGTRERKKLAKGRGIVPKRTFQGSSKDAAVPGRTRSGADLTYHDACDAGPDATVSTGGGKIIANVSLQLLFWGGWWNNSPTPSQKDVIDAVNSILQGPYMNALSQYGVGRGRLQGARVITAPAPNNPFSDDDTHAVISGLIDSGVFPEPDDPGGSNLYMLMLPANFNSTNPNAWGSHMFDQDYDFPADYDRAWFGWVTHDGTLDRLTQTFSHELVEACTDPEGDGVQVNPRNDSNWHEIADVCCSPLILNGICPNPLNGICVQSYWSDRDKACIIPTGLVSGGIANIPSLVQSHAGRKGNFELVVSQPSIGLAHYWRNNDDPFFPWMGPNAFGGSAGLIKGVSMIESNFGRSIGVPGHLEVVALAGDALVLFWRDSVSPFLWHGPYAITRDIIGLPALVQSTSGKKGNFELVAPGNFGLDHYWRDNDAPDLPWHGPTRIILGHFDAVSMIQSNLGTHGNLEVVARSGDMLMFFWRESIAPYAWQGPVPIIADGTPISGVSGNPVLIQSTLGRKGNFELLVHLATGGLAHYWRDNDAPGFPWHGPKLFNYSEASIEAITMIQSNFGSPGHLEVVGRTSEQLVSFWRESGPEYNWYGPFPITS